MGEMLEKWAKAKEYAASKEGKQKQEEAMEKIRVEGKPGYVKIELKDHSKDEIKAIVEHALKECTESEETCKEQLKTCTEETCTDGTISIKEKALKDVQKNFIKDIDNFLKNNVTVEE